MSKQVVENVRPLHAGESAVSTKRNRNTGTRRVLDVPLVGESILYSVFKKKNKLTGDMIAKLERMFVSALRDYDKTDDTRLIDGEPVTTLDIAVEIYSQLAMEYVELLAGVIPPEEHNTYCSSPEGFVKLKVADIPEYVRRKLELLTLSNGNSWNLSKAIIKLIRMGAAANIESGRLF
ncbi:MAG: hypothetical protein DRO87_07675 [Candidatus Thorarchaeota archaeon]|nr:MAG: hypothetical protein DRO87_07675 [Candidatus Thorarchaeota archaeon]RLI58248.1 MAG: hypothetical protein DRP09_00485 [Candidatus Thorarchaeota archaeon]